MRLYLVQHGHALPEDVDPDRPLSVEGTAAIRRLAQFLGQAGVRAGRVFHSGKTRARLTAELLCETVAQSVTPEQRKGLAPKDPVEEVAAVARAWAEDTLIVGHMPFLGKLVDVLVAADSPGGVAGFQPGTALCLQREEGGHWSIVWMVPPELVRNRD